MPPRQQNKKKKKKERSGNLSRAISFYWGVYLFLGLTCYLATFNDGKNRHHEVDFGWRFLQLGLRAAIKVEPDGASA